MLRFAPWKLASVLALVAAAILLVIPSFYDSIETSRDRAFAKFRRRNARWNTVLAFVVTLGEAVLTLLGLRLLWRSMLRLAGWLGGLLRRRQPV